MKLRVMSRCCGVSLPSASVSYQCALLMPCRKYRIGINFELIRTIPIHFDICIRANANHSEPISKTFVSRLMKNGKNRSDIIRFKPRQQSGWIRTNTNQSKLQLILIEFSIRINPNESEVEMVRINSDWKFGLDYLELGLIRIGSDSLVLLSRIKSDSVGSIFYRFSSNEIQMFFGLVRNDSHWLGYIYRNEFLSDTFARVVSR